MNNHFFSGLVFAAAMAISPVYAEQLAQPRIVNGADALVSDYPSFASLFQWYDANSGSITYGNYCGSTILNANYILTAAHCVYISSPSDEWRMLFTYVFPQLQNESESNLISSSTSKIRITEVHYHENYNSSTLLNDIAIVKLEQPLSLGVSAYADLATTSDEASYKTDSASFQAVGHGNTTSDVDTTSILQYANLTYLPIIPEVSCNYSAANPTTNLCMEGLITSGLEASTCQGDSGGPLYWADGSNQRLVGITSFGPASFCGDPDYSGTSVFTQVSRYQSWIDSVISGSRLSDYTFSESQRTNFRDDPDNYDYQYVPASTPTPPIVTSSSSSGGGALSPWGLLLVVALMWLRNRRILCREG